MKRNIRVVVLSAIFIVIVVVVVAILSRPEPSQHIDIRGYTKNICELNDTIKMLKEDIIRYKTEIDRITLEREQLQRELEQIINDNEKVDTELANGDWDNNIRFLTDFLSEEDNMGK